MTTLESLDTRVTTLETVMEVEVRFMRTTLSNHTEVLNAIRDAQIKQGERIDGLEKEMRAGFARVDAEFADVRGEMRQEFANVRGEMRQEFASVRGEMRSGFAMLAAGQAKITELITQHIEECEKN